MSIDAGTVYSSIRLKLDSLDRDINSAIGKLDGLVGRMSKVGANVQNIEKFGKSLTLGVTVPLVAASAALVKFASDEGESLNAANVVFGKSAKIITDWGENAAKQAGLAKSEFYQAGAVIGAGLKNAGFSLDDAANQTINLTQRAADMASIFNTDVNDAMLALQSALRGEYEPARRFAVSLSETAVKAEAMRLGIAKTGEELSTYQKTQARLSLIMQQTAQFQGDFVNTSDQLANSTRILQAELKNEAAQLGRELLPALLDIIKGARGIVENFSKLDEGTKKTVLAIAGFAAATGPVILGITNTIKAVEALKIAMLALAANPITLVIAGVAALGVGLKALGDENNKRMIEDVGERFKNVGELAEVSAQNIVDVEEVLARMSRGGGTATELKDSIKQIAEDTGLTAEQILAIGINSNKATKEFKDQLTLADKMLKTASEQAAMEKIRLSYMPGTAEYAERIRKSQEKTTVETQTQIELTKEQQSQIEARKKADEEYNKTINITNQKVRDGLLTQEEGYGEIAKAQGVYLNTLYELGYAAESEIGTKGRSAFETMLAAVKEANESARSKDFIEEYKKRVDAVTELSDTALSANEKARTQAIAELSTLKAVTEEEKAKKQELIDKTNDYYDKLKDKTAFEEFAKNATTSISTVSNLFSAIDSLITALAKAQIDALDAEMQARLEAAGLAEKTAVETAQAEYDAAVSSGNATTIEEKRQALERASIKEEYEKKKAKVEYDAAMASWGLQVAIATAQAAMAVLNAYSSGMAYPYIGPATGAAFATAAGITGALQVAAVIAAKPTLAFETGGIVPGTSFTGDKIVARVNSGEEVLTRDDPRNILNGGGSMVFILEVDGLPIAQATAPYFSNGQVRLKLK